MVNKKLDINYPEPAGLAREILKLTKKEYTGEAETQNAIEEVIREQEKAVNDYKKGNVNVIGFLIGMVQKKLKGKGDPKVIKDKLCQKLE